ncbi:MAG: efflux RND transporter periplasmic adaptor subunit [Phycisphaerae bacterium]
MKSHAAAVILVLILFFGAAIVAWRALAMEAQSDRKAEFSAPIAVEISPIESGRMRDIRVLSGTLEASTRFDVAAKVGGLIRELHVDLGDEIERGQVVAVLDDDEFVQAVAEAKAELAVRNAELDQAQSEMTRVEREFQRVEGLRQRGVASDYEFDEVAALRQTQQAAVMLSEARVRQAQASLELANIRLSYTHVRAIWQKDPERGIVGVRYEDAGETVQAGDPIFAIVGLDVLYGVVSVTERDYARLEIGQPAVVTTEALPGESFEAEVARIAPVFQTSSRQARVELRVENPARVLRPGMFIRVSIVLREADAETIVPLAAVVNRGESSVVFVVDKGGETVSAQKVELGIVREDRVQIVAPRLEGHVVVLGQHLLEDGATVTINE